MSDRKSKADCSGRYPAVWRFTYSHKVPERAWVGQTGDTENTGRMLTLEGQYDVIALNEGFAIEAFKLSRPASVYMLHTGPTFVCYVDETVSFR